MYALLLLCFSGLALGQFAVTGISYSLKTRDGGSNALNNGGGPVVGKGGSAILVFTLNQNVTFELSDIDTTDIAIMTFAAKGGSVNCPDSFTAEYDSETHRQTLGFTRQKMAEMYAGNLSITKFALYVDLESIELDYECQMEFDGAKTNIQFLGEVAGTLVTNWVATYGTSPTPTIPLPAPQGSPLLVTYPVNVGDIWITYPTKLNEVLSTDDATKLPQTNIRVSFDEAITYELLSTSLPPTLKLNYGTATFVKFSNDPSSAIGTGFMDFVFVPKVGFKSTSKDPFLRVVSLDLSGAIVRGIFSGENAEAKFNATLTYLNTNSNISYISNTTSWPPKGYDAKLIPTTGDEILPVTAYILINDIWDIDAGKGTFQMDFFYGASWKDTRFNVPMPYDKNYSFLINSTLLTQIWLPDLQFWNTRSTTRDVYGIVTINNDTGMVTLLKRSVVTVAWTYRPNDYPFDTQAFQIVFQASLSSAAGNVWFNLLTYDPNTEIFHYVPYADADQSFVLPQDAVEEFALATEDKLSRLYHPSWNFFNVNQSYVPNQSNYTPDLFMISFLGSRRPAIGSFLVLLPLTLIMVVNFWTLWLPLSKDSRVVGAIGALTAVSAASVTASNLNPPTSEITRMSLMIILTFVYVASLIVPHILIMHISMITDKMGSKIEKAEKKNEDAKEARDHAELDYEAACKAAKANGDEAPTEPSILKTPLKDNTLEIAEAFLWFFVVTPANYKKIAEDVEFINDFLKVFYAFLFFAFIAPVFLLPSRWPDQTQLGRDLVEGEGVQSERYLLGKTTVAIYAGFLGFTLLVIGLLWLLFRKKKTSVVDKQKSGAGHNDL